jgi:hypothetical protein
MCEARGAFSGVVGVVPSPGRFVARSGIVVMRGEGPPPTFTEARTKVRLYKEASCC